MYVHDRGWGLTVCPDVCGVTGGGASLCDFPLSPGNPIQLSDCDAVLAEQEKAQHNLKGLLKTKRQVLRERLQVPSPHVKYF